MKSNETQLRVLKEIEDQIKFWQSTNDISSPTHECDIHECIGNLSLFEYITVAQEEELIDKLYDLLGFIRTLEKK